MHTIHDIESLLPLLDTTPIPELIILRVVLAVAATNIIYLTTAFMIGPMSGHQLCKVGIKKLNQVMVILQSPEGREISDHVSMHTYMDYSILAHKRDFIMAQTSTYYGSFKDIKVAHKFYAEAKALYCEAKSLSDNAIMGKEIEAIGKHLKEAEQPMSQQGRREMNNSANGDRAPSHSYV